MTSTEMNRIVRATGESNAKDLRRTTQEVLAQAGPWRPLGFETSQRRRRDHYIGQGAQHVRAKIMKMYPRKGDKIEVLPFNWARHHAATTASFYDEEPSRTLVDADSGEELEEGDDTLAAFREAVEQSRARVKLPEADRRAVWMGEAVIAVRVRKTIDPADGVLKPSVRIELHWALDCFVLPDPESPSDLQRAYAFVLRVNAKDLSGRKCVAYETWTRAAEDVGGWEVSTNLASGEEVVAREPYEGSMLPFVLLHSEDPDALPFVEIGDDDVDMVEMLNVGIADEAHIGRMQGHTDRVYRGSRNKNIEQVGGPDATMVIDTGEELTTLDYNPKLEELRTANSEFQKTWALTKQSSIYSYTVEGGASPESGFAREISNAPQEKMRRARDALIVEKEERELWPIVGDVWSVFVDPSRPIVGVRYKVTPRRRKAHEDGEAKERRLSAAVDRGVITLARYAVEMDYYVTIEDAVEAGISDELKGAAPAATPPVGPDGQPLSRFAARLTSQRAAPAEDATDEVPALEGEEVP